jgi:site-specific recombinase XerD
MRNTKTKTLQSLVQDFFCQHLATERNASANTVTSYRDAIKLFLGYASGLMGCTPDQLDHRALDVETIRSFLDWLKRERGCGERTRNHRLASIKAFARYIATVAPEHLERCRLIREMPSTSVEHPEIQYLTEEEIVTLISSVDASSPKGRRDRAILLLLYNTGARVQELVDLDIGDINKQPIAFVRLQGKGRKQRTCPLWSRTVAAIDKMLADRRSQESVHPLFLNARGQRLSRSGIAYLLRRAQKKSGLRPDHAIRLTPHVFRHTTAMHLLQSGVDITTIAAWLGHAQLATTHGYVEINLRMKQAVIARDDALPEISDGEYPPPDIVDWLDQLAHKPGYVQPAVINSPKGGHKNGLLHITKRGG